MNLLMKIQFFSGQVFAVGSRAVLRCCVLSAVVLVFGCGPKDETKTIPSEPKMQDTLTVKPEQKAQVAPSVVDRKNLEGSWVRSDAEYVIALEKLADDGTVKAQYFNPKPINVGKAMWRIDEGFIAVYVELNDVNYPGSNYTLVYLPDRDMFAGQYYQAVDRETFNVSFSRLIK
jgi:hypothetical protein